MRFLSVNHLRLVSSPGGIPSHLATDSRAFSTRAAWQRAVALAVQHDVHAVLLSGQTLSTTNTGLAAWGPAVRHGLRPGDVGAADRWLRRATPARLPGDRNRKRSGHPPQPCPFRAKLYSPLARYLARLGAGFHQKYGGDGLPGRSCNG